MFPESSVLGDSTHERISPDDLMLKKTELEQRDSRAGTLDSTHESFADIFASELVQLAKHQKWFSLAAREVAWRQCLPVVLKGSQSCC